MSKADRHEPSTGTRLLSGVRWGLAVFGIIALFLAVRSVFAGALWRGVDPAVGLALRNWLLSGIVVGGIAGLVQPLLPPSWRVFANGAFAGVIFISGIILDDAFRGLSVGLALWVLLVAAVVWGVLQPFVARRSGDTLSDRWPLSRGWE